ncbi:MAG TPA: Rnf-Nqr domain containing protein [Spirochaetales bacterium]|nr:Rnf-Nqr domain containing protein [Spirochaetales bacterium]HRY54723.1 Rnf-Nqr domain containing protein [Spirochaetia bacterium]HRZ63828.1 Rnf-Nqr domain containing protein [Spirochaetia bacterium]
MREDAAPFTPNPVLAGLFGLGPLAVAARSLPEGLLLGLGAAFCALALGLAAPPLRRQLPERFRASASLILATAFAILYGQLIEAYFPVSAEGLGIYLPLLAVNCLSLQAIRQGARQGPRPSGPAAEAPLRYGIIARGAGGYLAVAILLGALRELIGLGSLSLPGLGQNRLILLLSEEPPLRLIAAPAGGFILIGFLTALYRAALRASGRRIV